MGSQGPSEFASLIPPRDWNTGMMAEWVLGKWRMGVLTVFPLTESEKSSLIEDIF
jgi:hypothetical protein